MREFTKRVFAGLVSSAIFTSVLFLASVNPTPQTWLGSILSNPFYRYGLIGIVVFGVSLTLIRHIQSFREELRKSNAPSVQTVKREPRYVEAEGEIEKWGVIWKAKYGTMRRTGSGSPYSYVTGPYCPHDGTELERRKVRRLLVKTQRVWTCPECDRDYTRPRKHLHNEQSAVEKIFDRMFEEELD